MKSSQILDNSFLDILKEVYDNPSNKHVVTLLKEAGFKRSKLMDYYNSQKSLTDDDIAYIKEFLKISTHNLYKKDLKK